MSFARFRSVFAKQTQACSADFKQQELEKRLVPQEASGGLRMRSTNLGRPKVKRIESESSHFNLHQNTKGTQNIGYEFV